MHDTPAPRCVHDHDSTRVTAGALGLADSPNVVVPVDMNLSETATRYRHDARIQQLEPTHAVDAASAQRSGDALRARE
jgi:hypothetical protein